MTWASHPTTEMPTRASPPVGRHRLRRRTVITLVSATGLAALVVGAMLAPSLIGWPPPAGMSGPAGLATESAPPPAQTLAASPATPSVSVSVADSPDLELEVFTLTNTERAGHDCPALRLDANLAAAARAHSAEMARTGVFAHTSANGTDPGERLRLAGYDIGRGWAENIARGQPNAAAVMAAWLGSSQHRGNILDCSLLAVGIGAARSSSGQIYWTQDFGGR